jgi:hypothetical protein
MYNGFQLNTTHVLSFSSEALNRIQGICMKNEDNLEDLDNLDKAKLVTLSSPEVIN